MTGVLSLGTLYPICLHQGRGKFCGFGYGSRARKSMPGPLLALFSVPYLREACPSAPGPWPLSSVSYRWPGPDQASVKGSKGSGQPPCWSCPCVRAKWLQSCLILWDPMDCNPPGSSVHGILQARILEWVAMPSPRGSSRPKDPTWVSYVFCIGRWVLYHPHHLGSPLVSPEASQLFWGAGMRGRCWGGGPRWRCVWGWGRSQAPRSALSTCWAHGTPPCPSFPLQKTWLWILQGLKPFFSQQTSCPTESPTIESPFGETLVLFLLWVLKSLIWNPKLIKDFFVPLHPPPPPPPLSGISAKEPNSRDQCRGGGGGGGKS